jgi:hypothetical protein
MKSSAPLHHRNSILHLQERQEYDRAVLQKEPAHKEPTSKQIAQLHTEYAITSIFQMFGVFDRSTRERALKATL